MPKQKQRLARLRLKKKRVQNANAKKIANVRSVQMLLLQNSEKKNAKSVLNKLVAAEIATVVICGF
jgi:hypothetical protein